ncbi:MAG: hypothetical protein K2K29_07145, partial [Muribaculaceae bacterium]|nr:hypothetical protein [Muribaculaceae bacterium]
MLCSRTDTSFCDSREAVFTELSDVFSANSTLEPADNFEEEFIGVREPAEDTALVQSDAFTSRGADSSKSSNSSATFS